MRSTTPSRSARSRTWAGDSSPLTSSVRRPEAPIAPSACSSSELLPTPGSPPTSTSEPGTRPPPSTRSSSSRPVGHPGRVGGRHVAQGMGAGGTHAPPGGRRSITSSTIVFHSPQPPQRPIHLGLRWPQAEHA